MSFFIYLYQLRASFRKFLNSKRAVAINQEKTTYALEVNADSKYNLRQQCKKAAMEIKYISSFTYWPTAKAKVKTQKNSLVYLDISRSKLDSLEQRNKRGSHTVEVIKNPTFANKITTVKKIPNR